MLFNYRGDMLVLLYDDEEMEESDPESPEQNPIHTQSNDNEF